MRQLGTRTAEWWWFLEQGRCSQLVGIRLFTFYNDTAFVGRLYLFSVLCRCPGIDLADMATDVLQPQGDDTARVSWNLRKKITAFQETFSVIERVRPEEYFCLSHSVFLCCLNTFLIHELCVFRTVCVAPVFVCSTMEKNCKVGPAVDLMYS